MLHIELSEYDIQFVPRGSIKSQVLADFVVELTSPSQEEVPFVWLLSVDGSSNLKGSGEGIILEGPEDIIIEQSLRFEFKASNNQAEYEALIAGMTLAQEMGAENLRAKSDSQLLTSQITGEYQTKDPQIIKYPEKVRILAKRFVFFEAVYVPREQNSKQGPTRKSVNAQNRRSPKTDIRRTNHFALSQDLCLGGCGPS